jgi:hypothetical protein
MVRLLLALAMVVSARLWAAGAAADVSRQVRDLNLDPEECYRIHDVSFSREEIRLFLADGYLIFSKPIGGIRTAAVFAADVAGGDAEILVFPPHRDERLSLAAFTRRRLSMCCSMSLTLAAAAAVQNTVLAWVNCLASSSRFFRMA